MKEGFEKNRQVSKQLTLPFPNVEFQALTRGTAAKPDAVFSFFAEVSAVKFVKDYHASGLAHGPSALRPRLSDRRHALEAWGRPHKAC